MEIERKYLIKYMPELGGAQVKKIEQGYLNRKPVLRIRKSNDRYIFTYKSKVGFDQSKAIQNDEIERELPREAYEHLREKVDGALIAKTRYVILLEDGHKAELDVFEGAYEGLVFVEVEFTDIEDAERFVKPDWFGEDVSEEQYFSNAYLSELSGYEEWKRNREEGLRNE